MVELIVVAAILIMMASLALPVLQSSDLAGAQARRVLADAIRTRSQARTNWQNTILRTDLVTDRWRCELADGTPIEGPGADAEGWRSLDKGAHFQTVEGLPSLFTFQPNGRGQELAAVRIVYDSSAWIIQLDPLSGSLIADPE